jgi:GH15 family glucan-1,4-alpha-glucosidase
MSIKRKFGKVVRMIDSEMEYRPLNDYALIGDCHGVALVSRLGSVDWAAMPRIDDNSTFARILDRNKGGFWSISPCERILNVKRYYETGTMVLVTEFETANGEIRLIDFMALSKHRAVTDEDMYVRQVEGINGEVDMQYILAPRFDYGLVLPCIRQHGNDASARLYMAWGSNHGLVIYADARLEARDQEDLSGRFKVKTGDKFNFSIRTVAPEEIGAPDFDPPETADYLNKIKRNTLQYWRQWSDQANLDYCHDKQTLRSALVLKALTVEKTGAVAAAATTSLPETIGGVRNWDYRFSWIRDSVFTVRALHELGFKREADRFADFIERSAAGSADQLRVVFGVDGRRRLVENELPELNGYRGSRPVRIGNEAIEQAQHDAYGELLELAWARHSYGSTISETRWAFLRHIVAFAVERWDKPDYGIWEVRGEPQRFVFSMALCWRAVDRGIALAEHYDFDAPLVDWRATRDSIRTAIETDGYNTEKGIFRQAFGSDYLDSSLLLLPWFGFIEYEDPRMVRTTEALRKGLDDHGLLRRYDFPDGLPGREGAFLPSSFWLVECLAHQNKRDMALQYYEKAISCANDVGLFPEEYDAKTNTPLGNLPQGLTHLAQIIAKQAMIQTGCV